MAKYRDIYIKFGKYMMEKLDLWVILIINMHKNQYISVFCNHILTKFCPSVPLRAMPIYNNFGKYIMAKYRFMVKSLHKYA